MQLVCVARGFDRNGYKHCVDDYLEEQYILRHHAIKRDSDNELHSHTAL